MCHADKVFAVSDIRRYSDPALGGASSLRKGQSPLLQLFRQMN